MNQGRNRRVTTPRVRRAERIWPPQDPEVWLEENSPVTQDETHDALMEEAPEAFSERTDLSPRRPAQEQPETIATNMTVRLTCTLCAMMSPLAVFMCYAERESRAIRCFAVQSTALAAVHAALIALLLTLAGVLGGIPYMGFLIQLLSWLTYFAALVALLIMRVQMMLHAWRGFRFKLPLLGPWLEKYVDMFHAGEMN